MAVVGPEQPLVNGITDFMKLQGIPCFGPSQKASIIEAEKVSNITSTHTILYTFQPTSILLSILIIQRVLYLVLL